MGKTARKLTIKQKKYVDGVLNGLSQRVAYRIAYPSSRKWKDNVVDVKASELLKTPMVENYFKARQKEIERKTEQRKEKSIQERTIIIDEYIYDLMVQNIKEYDSIKDFVQEAIKKNLPINVTDMDEWLKVNRRKNISESNRYQILENAGFKCQACGAKPTKDNDVELEIDHIMPFSLGGIDHASNYQCLCKDCNASKGNRYAIDHRQTKKTGH